MGRVWFQREGWQREGLAITSGASNGLALKGRLRSGEEYHGV